MATQPPVPGLMPQKDGSFAITIECPKGVVEPRILEALAKVSREHGAIVHPTIAQKIMLLGLEEEAAKTVLNLLEEAGATVRKARDLSHPRVCVGKPYCKLAFQDTFALSEYLYEKLARTPTMPKFKVGISGCPACCTWANMMDLGFMGVRSGYKVFVGGHGGVRPIVGQEILKIQTREEAARILETLAALFNDTVKKKARFDLVIKKLGIEKIKEELEKALERTK